MAKKLMMNNYSENGLMPVMDGLICWLDGRDGKTGDAVWKDRSGNGNDAVFVNNKTIFENGKLTLDGDNYANLPFGLGEDLNKHSFCVCASKNTNNTYNSMMLACENGYNQRKYIDFDKFSPRIGYGSTFKTSSKVLSQNELNVFTFNIGANANLYVNAELTFSLGIQNNVKLASNFIIGTNNVEQKYNLIGNIASVLIYNRPLTEEEIQQNYLYEQSIERG